MIIFRNISKKIIGIGNAVVMPDESIELDDSVAELPAVQAFVRLDRAIITKVAPPVEKKPVAKKPVVVEAPVEEPDDEPVAEPENEPVAEPEPPVEEVKPKRSRSKKTKATEEEDSKAVEEELAEKIFG